ncbi:hypothetical protein SEA_DATBOI_145 [Gordonia phage DatBoi]|nr:hypothetical protein SEA_DATBOI_145 [Gordonia phage DatBoi]
MGQVLQTGVVVEDFGSTMTHVNHIDTYSVFDLGSDSHIEGEQDHIAESLGVDFAAIEDVTWWEYFDIDWDMQSFIEWLAEASIYAIQQALPHELIRNGDKAPIWKSTDPVILDVEWTGETWSPAFYNFTTDGYMARWEIDADALNRWLDDNEITLEDGRNIPGFARTADDEFWYMAKALEEYLSREVFPGDLEYEHAIWEQMATECVEMDMCQVTLTEQGAAAAIAAGADPDEVARFTERTLAAAVDARRAEAGAA